MNQLKVLTSNKELCRKFTMLNYTNDCILKTVNENSLSNIIKKINRKEKYLSVEKIGNIFFIQKLKPISFNVNLRRT